MLLRTIMATIEVDHLLFWLFEHFEFRIAVLLFGISYSRFAVHCSNSVEVGGLLRLQMCENRAATVWRAQKSSFSRRDRQ